ncbi:SpoIIE family protein phosphatase [candidate division KSB1 bacterium]|nr:SpoIIE family protein phosphatase [candidate division KSB1 bacterium]
MFRTVVKEELRVPGRVEHLGELRDFVTHVGRKFGFSERIINAFKLSIDEAATNIIKHAYRDWEGDITLRALAKRDSLTMVLIDQGKYFDPRQVNSPDLQRYVEIGKKGGLGIFIMRRLLDGIEYRKSEEGNELWMVKNRDEEKKKKLSFSAIPLSLKMRYWLYSLIIFTIILFVISLYNFLNTKKQIVNNYINSGRIACESLDNNLRQYWESVAVTSDVFTAFKESGSKEVPIVDGALNGIKAIQESQEHRGRLKEIIITNNQDMLIASSDSSKSETIWLQNTRVTVPDDARLLHEFENSSAFLLHNANDGKMIDIVWPILDDDRTKLATTHFYIDYALVEKDISRYVRGLVGKMLFIWGLVSAGLFLLIYVVMYPFQRLQVWVKNLNEPGASEQMDIDASTEIGAIAQAFSDVTNQLKRSQVDLAEQERLQQEMHIAKQIQQTLLPAEFPQVEGYDIASFYAAAKDVGGDFYDFVEVDSDTLGIAVADVSGKGVPGAFVMTMIRTALRSEARGVKDAAEVLAKVNEFVVNDMKKGMFVTLFYVIIDSKRRRLNFASAGHNPMILHRASKNKTYYLNPRGFPIGISLPDKDLFRKSIESDTIALAEDDILMVYTDGVTEAMNPKRRLFGEERFLRLVRENGKKTADEFIDNLKKEMNIFTEGSEQNDDITLVAVKEKLSAERVEYDRAVRAYQSVQNGIGIKEACREAGISTYSYYQKYKEKFDREGVGNFVASEELDQIEAKHLSIEEKNKIYDIIRRFPEYGAKRISEELKTERYEFAHIPTSRIYEELLRMRLNTRELREAFVQRGGKKKRIKAPGTPMMTLDGKIIMNRTQYEETDDDEEPNKEEVQKTTAPETGVDAGPTTATEETPQVEERTTPNVFAIDKKTLLIAPLEEIFDRRPKEEEAASPQEISERPTEEAPIEQDDDDIESIFGFVENDAFPADMDGDQTGDATDETAAVLQNDNWTVVSDDQLKDYQDADFDEDEEIDQIEEKLFGEPNELEILSSYSDDETDFGLDFGFDDEKDDSPQAEQKPPHFARDEATDDQEDLEIFDFDEFQMPFADAESGMHADQSDELPEESDEEFGPSSLDDDALFDFSTESSEKAVNDGNNGRNDSLSSDSEIFSQDHDFADPFEEFLELEEEFGLIGEDGDLDQELSDTLLASENDFSADDDHTIKIEPTGDDRDVDEEDKKISLDRLVSVANDEESFFTQRDEEFDELIKDAMTNDGRMEQLLSGHMRADENEQEKNAMIESELRHAMQLYSESQFDDAIKKLNSLAEKFPQDHRAHSLLGNAYFREKKFKQASSEYERVIDLDPLNEKACENLAISYAKQGELEKAIHHWERLLNIAPNRLDVRASIQRARVFLQKY